MDAGLKKTLKAVTLELRHLLEGRYDSDGKWKPGDLEQRLAAVGVRRDRASVPVDELRHLAEEDREARKIVDAYLKLREEAGVGRSDAVAEFVRETAYTWANRLLALRCMEARELIDSVILQQEAYGGRSLEHHRLAQRHPELCSGDDDGLFALLDDAFREQAEVLPMLFDPQAPGIALRPAPAALKDCFGLLSLKPDTLRKYRIRLKEDEATDAGNEPPSPFTAPDTLGWAYQYWNTEEKERVFTKVRTERATIEGAELIPATQLYTEPYMVKFLVQNSLGATWVEMNPGSRLADAWEYFVRDADRAAAVPKRVAEITFLDPAVGSGHFLLEAFDLFWGMYEEEATNKTPEAIAASILNNNLFGIDIDERAVQIAQAALWMKTKERAPDISADEIAGFRNHLVATNIRLSQRDDHVRAFLDKHPEDSPLRHALPAIFAGLAHANELGSLLRIEEIVDDEIAAMRRADPLFAYSMAAEGWKGRIMVRLREHFETEARAADLVQAFFSRSAGNGLALFDLLERRYDVVTANPPWMGSKNMGPILRRYLEWHYGPGKRDLYAAFILRCLGLAAEGGRVAMVTQQSWMFLHSFEELRASEVAHDGFRGILRMTSIEVMAQLGRYAFSELGNGVIQPQLFVLTNYARHDSFIFCLRLTAPRIAQEQARLLRSGTSGRAPYIISKPTQAKFLSLPGSPLCYWLTDHFLSLLSGRIFRGVVESREGITTTDKNIFIRLNWEAAEADGWPPVPKGGAYSKWEGLEYWVLDWRDDGARLRSVGKATLRNLEFWNKPGWTYAQVARGAMALRRLPQGTALEHKGPAIFGLDNQPVPAAVFNCRLVSYILRLINQGYEFRSGSIERVPVPRNDVVGRETLETSCCSLKHYLISHSLLEKSFDATSRYDQGSLLGIDGNLEDGDQAVSATLHAVEGALERAVFTAYEFEEEEITIVLDETRTPAGWRPLIAGYE